MSEHKRYYWLQLQEGFFNQKEIKKLRKIAGGDTFTIIYLKILIRSMNDDGKLYFEGYENDFPSELALDIDEDVDNVRVTVQYLISNGILIQCTESEYEILTAKEMIGSETDSARRMRRMRNAQTLQLTQNQPKTSHCDGDVTQSDANVRSCDTDIYREKEREKDKKIKERKRNTFIPPTVEEVSNYIKEKGYQIDPQYFFDHYESIGWMVGQSKMVSWKATVRTWESRNKQFNKEKQKQNQTTNTQRSKDSFNVNKNDEPRRVGSGTVI